MHSRLKYPGWAGMRFRVAPKSCRLTPSLTINAAHSGLLLLLLLLFFFFSHYLVAKNLACGHRTGPKKLWSGLEWKNTTGDKKQNRNKKVRWGE